MPDRPWRSSSRSSSSSTRPWRTSRSARAPEKKDDGGGIGGFLGNLGGDVKDFLVSSGPGAVAAGAAIGHDVASLAGRVPGSRGFAQRAAREDFRTDDLARAVAETYKYQYGPLFEGDFGEFGSRLYEHPLGPILDVASIASLGAGSAARGAAALKAAKTGGKVGSALRHGPKTELRRVKLPESEAKVLLGAYSRSTLARQTQKFLDGIRERFPNTPILGRSLYRKVGFQQRRLGEIEERLGRVGVNELLLEAGGLNRITKAQHRALRVVGEGVSIDKRIARHKSDLLTAQNALHARRLRKEITLLEKARKYVDEAGNLTDPKLQKVYDLVKQSAQRREDLLALVDELAPEQAAARVQQPARVFGPALEGAPGETFFTYSSRKRPTSFARLGASRVIRHPRSPVGKTFTGKAITEGRIPKAEALLAAEAELEAWRFTTILRNRERLIALSKEMPDRGSDIAIVLDELKGKTLPEEVRAFLNKAATSEILPEEELTALARIGEGLRQQIFPGSYDELKHLEAYKNAVEAPIPGVRWVDSRLLGGLNAVNPLVGFSGNLAGKAVLGTVDAINNATRAALLYLLPLKYITPNALSQTAFALIQQGFAAPANLARAARLSQGLGKKAAAAIDAGMGEGFAVSIAGETTGPLTRFNRAAANFYGKIIDVPFRRAAFLHEARRAGHTSKAEIEKLLFDPKLRDERLAIFLEANAEIIDYARMGRWERNIIRRVIFFYPWVKGATAYAPRFLVEHPGKAWALDQLGKVGSEIQAEAFGGMLPSYAEALAPVGESGGLPLSVNMMAVSPFTTPYGSLRALTGDPRSAYVLGGQFSPALNAAIMAAGFTPPGAYEAGFGAAARELYEGLPEYRYPKRALEGPSERAVYPTTRLEDILSLIFGTGVAPRRTSPERLAEEAKRGR